MTVVPGQPPPYSSVFGAGASIVRNEGFLGLYRGMLAPLIGVVPMYMLCFFGYGLGKQIFFTERTIPDLELWRIGAAGATSGFFSTPILAPLERLKCILQVQNAQPAKPGEVRYKGPRDLGLHLYRTGGLKSLNRGYMATNLRDSVASVGYFTAYEWTKRQLTPEGASGPGVLGTLVAGGVAGICNWLPAIPIDTLKTRLQIAPEGKYRHGIRSVLRDMIKENGTQKTIRALYRGTGAVLLRAVPANAACFLGVETARTALRKVLPPPEES